MPQRQLTRRVTFRSPASFSTLGKPLPPGAYDVIIVEEEVWRGGTPSLVTLECKISLPPTMVPHSGAVRDVPVDRWELERQATVERRQIPR